MRRGDRCAIDPRNNGSPDPNERGGDRNPRRLRWLSLQCALADVAALVAPGWDRENGGADRNRPGVEHVLLCQSLLDRHELANRVGLVGSEQQTRIADLAGIRDIVIVVRSPQDRLGPDPWPSPGDV